MILENYMEIMVDEAIKDYLDKNQEIIWKAFFLFC